jgi:hypothetical protein
MFTKGACKYAIKDSDNGWDAADVWAAACGEEEHTRAWRMLCTAPFVLIARESNTRDVGGDRRGG